MPRRWGKTVNLNMLRRFLEIPVDDNGAVLDKTSKQTTANYKLFAGGQVDTGIRGQAELSPLIIANTRLFDNTEALTIQGTRPVIYIDFKSCKGGDFDTVQAGIKRVLKDCFKLHGYLKNSGALDNEEQALFKNMQALSHLSLSAKMR